MQFINYAADVIICICLFCVCCYCLYLVYKQIKFALKDMSKTDEVDDQNFGHDTITHAIKANCSQNNVYIDEVKNGNKLVVVCGDSVMYVEKKRGQDTLITICGVQMSLKQIKLFSKATIVDEKKTKDDIKKALQDFEHII